MAVVALTRVWRHSQPINIPHRPNGAQAITPSDADTFAEPVHVYVGVAGNVSVVPAAAGSAGSAVLFKGMPAGSTLPVKVWAVKSTNTTATDLVAVYD